jgi:hypothetical protein
MSEVMVDLAKEIVLCSDPALQAVFTLLTFLRKPNPGQHALSAGGFIKIRTMEAVARQPACMEEPKIDNIGSNEAKVNPLSSSRKVNNVIGKKADMDADRNAIL